MSRAAFTLLELLVVLVIIALLLAIVLPVLGSARSAGRSAACMSNLRQWGIAAAVYMHRHRDYLPKPQGEYDYGETAIDDPYAGNWYNALPPLVGAPRYTDIYDGSKTDEYPHANIWWCPEQRARYGPGGFTFSAGNAFDYAFNTVLDGTDSYSNSGNDGQHHIRVDRIPQPTKTLMMTEPSTRVEYVSIGTPGVSADRHYGYLANMLFIDGHVSAMDGLAAQQVSSGPDLPKAPRWSRYWTTNQGHVVWGSFYGR